MNDDVIEQMKELALKYTDTMISVGARITTTKPDERFGHLSLLTGVTEGIHPLFITHYKRRVDNSPMDLIMDFERKINEDTISQRLTLGVQPN